jgi:hypothetical protein
MDGIERCCACCLVPCMARFHQMCGFALVCHFSANNDQKYPTVTCLLLLLQA